MYVELKSFFGCIDLNGIFEGFFVIFLGETFFSSFFHFEHSEVSTLKYRN